MRCLGSTPLRIACNVVLMAVLSGSVCEARAIARLEGAESELATGSLLKTLDEIGSRDRALHRDVQAMDQSLQQLGAKVEEQARQVEDLRRSLLEEIEALRGDRRRDLVILLVAIGSLATVLVAVAMQIFHRLRAVETPLQPLAPEKQSRLGVARGR